ncbi:hypothetical protein SNL152K_4512 [Streptomyces sp. NL15-2K]|nr:hypothetical protein SNL152K_4512 [Streptomyces sp. NL15-2K]
MPTRLPGAPILLSLPNMRREESGDPHVRDEKSTRRAGHRVPLMAVRTLSPRSEPPAASPG